MFSCGHSFTDDEIQIENASITASSRMRQWQISIRLRAKCVYTSPPFIGCNDWQRYDAILAATEVRQAMVRRLTKGVAPTRPVTNTRAQRRTNDPASGDDSEDVIRYQVSRSVLRRIYIRLQSTRELPTWPLGPREKFARTLNWRVYSMRAANAICISNEPL